MAVDVSYFKVNGDNTEYAFNDPTAEQAVVEETTRATAAEQALSTDISAETTRATAAETANANAISAEVTRATGVEGTLSNLTTTAKTTLVAAINEVDGNTDTNTAAIGALGNLTTDAKGNLVAAVNEVDAAVDSLSSAMSGLIGYQTFSDQSITSNGNVALNHSKPIIGTNYVSAGSFGSVYGVPYRSSSGWNIHLVNFAQESPTSGTVTITIYYLNAP